MRADVFSFCNTCLHCQSTNGGRRIPRPLAHTLHADKPNELLHFDYLYMHPSETGEQYVLIVKDDASSFIWLEPTEASDAHTTVKVLAKWSSLFGIAPMWCSDRGTHFKNEVMRLLNRTLRARHHFTIPYCPQSNGTVETVCKEVLRACRALLSEFQLKESEWPVVIPLIQSTLNHSVRPSLGNRAPVTVFAGLPADNPLRTVYPADSSKVQTIELTRARCLINAEALEFSLDAMHKDVSERRTRHREQASARHNALTHVRAINFEVGDFVLVAKREHNDGHKLRVT